MKKKKVKKFIFMCFKKGLLISLVISLFVFVPTITTVYKTREEALSNKFFGKKAEFQGVITLWNVDTFEGGSASRKSFFENVSLLFEKKNKGAYIKIENLSIDEFLIRIKEGKKPNLFSFGTGVQEYLKNEIISLPSDILSKIKPNFLSCGMDENVLKAVPWCFNIYLLISSKDRVEKAGKSYNGSLKELALSLAYDKKYKKKTKHIYSLTFGGNSFVNAVGVLPRIMDLSVKNQVDNGNIDKNYKYNTFYDAYSRFVNQNASVLLGTLRDVFRMENRKMAGEENEVLYEPYLEYTDLVSYISLINSETKIENVCKDFISFLISDEIQKKLSNIGLMSTTRNDVYADGIMSKLEKDLTDSLLVKNLFL